MTHNLLTILCLCPAGLLAALFLWSVLAIAASADEELGER